MCQFVKFSDWFPYILRCEMDGDFINLSRSRLYGKTSQIPHKTTLYRFYPPSRLLLLLQLSHVVGKSPWIRAKAQDNAWPS